MPVIDWELLGDAVAYYKSLGFKYVEAPWTASHAAIYSTMPAFARPWESSEGLLVGSAEQSFVDMDMRGELGVGSFVACTPCFRDEVEDSLHRKTFMKVEVYRNDMADDLGAIETVGIAMAFFRQKLTKIGLAAEAVRTDDGWDINVGGVEVGSYGYRRAGELGWVYGTGLAEPRFSTAVERARGHV